MSGSDAAVVIPPTPGAVLAVDIGGTSLKGAAFDRTGLLIARRTVRTLATGGDVLAGVVALLRLLLADAERLGETPTGIGLASPGLVDAASGVVVFAANLGWRETPVRQVLEAEFGLPVRLDHDARAGATAEQAARGAGHPDSADLVFIPIGTGVSAAVFTSGVLVTGATGAAGEFGHVPVIPDGELCSCGSHGCIEAYASASRIVARYLRDGGTRATTTPGILALLDSDPIAAAVWRDALDALALGIVSLTAVLDPAVVVIGGGMSGAGDQLLVPLRAAVDQRLGWRSTPRIVLSTLGAEAGLLGAALLARSDAPSSTEFVGRAHSLLAVSPPPSPAVSDPATSTPATSTPATSIPATSTPVTTEHP